MSAWPFDPDDSSTDADTGDPGYARQAALEEAAQRAASNRLLATGAVVIVIGIAVTAGTYASASQRDGGTYLVAWGPIVWGGWQIIRGISARR